jgi:hypothetical protein
VIALVTCVAYQHLVVITRLSARLTDLAFGTLPTSSNDWIHLHSRIKAVAMVMLTTAGAEQLIRYVAWQVADDTECFLIGDGNGFICMIGAQQRHRLYILEASTARCAWIMILLGTAQIAAIDGGAIARAVTAFL